MRKSFVKVLTLAPVMLVALTACQASLSSDKAKERAAGYDVAVLDNYASVKVTEKYSDVEATGVLETMGAAFEDNESDVEPEEAFCTEAAIELIDAQAGEHTSDSGLVTKNTIQYFAYKKTGLKIVVKSEASGKMSGLNASGKGEQTIWVLDDGRLEKENRSSDLKVEGAASGITMTGTLKYKLAATYTWTAK